MTHLKELYNLDRIGSNQIGNIYCFFRNSLQPLTCFARKSELSNAVLSNIRFVDFSRKFLEIEKVAFLPLLDGKYFSRKVSTAIELILKDEK